MSEPRDELDTWLSARVQPLLPPPGTFERVSRQARRRRARRAVLAAKEHQPKRFKVPANPTQKHQVESTAGEITLVP